MINYISNESEINKLIKNVEKMQEIKENMWDMSLKTRLFVHLKPQIIKKIGNPGTRVLKLKNLTHPKAQKPGYPGSATRGSIK